MEWSAAGVWLAYVVFPATALTLVLLLWIQRRLNRRGLVRAEIVRIDPFFHPDHPIRAEWLKCDYVFRVPGHPGSFVGNCLMPLHVFLPAGENDSAHQVAIWQDSRLDMPVLFHGGQRMIGGECVEHYLLSHRDSIRVRYRSRNPIQNMPLEADILPKKVVENKPRGG